MSVREKRRPLYPCALGAAFICFAIGTASENPGAGLVFGLLGALFGLYVSGVIRLFPAHPAGFPVIGVLVGPLPMAFLGENVGDRGGAVLFGLVLGLLLGLLEWAVEAERRRTNAAPPSADDGA